MKKLHRSDLFGWSIFNEERNIDFNSTLWVRSQGNVIIDPLPLIEHDKKHLESLGGAAHVIITNSDHIRDAAKIARDESFSNEPESMWSKAFTLSTISRIVWDCTDEVIN